MTAVSDAMRFRVRMVVLLSLMILLPPTVSAVRAQEDQEWPTFNLDWSRTGYVDAELSSELKLLWEFPGEWDVIQSQSSPAIAGGKVYFTAENMENGPSYGLLHIYALDAENGSLVWSYRAGRDAGAGALPSPTVVGGRVYVGDENYLYAFDAETGEVKWRFDVFYKYGLHGVDGAPIVIDNRVYFGTWDGWFYCLDANTGELIWKYSHEVGSGSINEVISFSKMGHVYGSPAYADGVIYFSTGAGSGGYTGWIYALNAENGSLIWKFYAGDEASESLAVVENRVYAGFGYFGHLLGDGMWAFDARSGAELWRFDTENQNYGISPPAVAHGKVYFTSDDGYLYAVDAENGSVLWRHYVSPLAGTFDYVIVVGNKVVVTKGEGLHILDAETGELLRATGGGSNTVGVAYAYGKLYVMDYQMGLLVFGPVPRRPSGIFWTGWLSMFIALIVLGVLLLLVPLIRKYRAVSEAPTRESKNS